MSTIEEWNVQYSNAVKSLQQVSKQINDRIIGIRGGQDRRMFAQLNAKNQQTLRNLRTEHTNLQRSLNYLSRFDLQPKDVQLYSAKLDQFMTQLDELDKRSRMTETEIMGEARFDLFLFLSSFS